MPAVRIVHNSERVIRAKYGLTVSMDSTPTKMLLAATSDSAPLMRISRVKTHAKALISRGMIRA